jgi:hypothetical protein
LQAAFLHWHETNFHALVDGGGDASEHGERMTLVIGIIILNAPSDIPCAEAAG